MAARGGIETVERLFRAIEQRDAVNYYAVWGDAPRIHEPDFLPYGGDYQGREGVLAHAAAWLRTWEPLQGPAERAPRAIFLDAGDQVVATWRLRARSRGDTLATPVVGVYTVRDGRIEEASLFYSAPERILEFLRGAGGTAPVRAAG